MNEYINRQELMDARQKAIWVYENANILNAQAIRDNLKPLLDETDKHGRWYLADDGDGHICVRAPLMDASLLAIKALRSQHHGKWLKNWCDTGMVGHEYAECSLCGCQMIDTNVFWDSKFCPRCGAQMIKES